MRNDKEGVGQSVRLEQIGEDRWRDYQCIRIEMLDSDPSAFPPQAERDRFDPEEVWRSKINSGIIILAYDGDAPVGMVRGTTSGQKGTIRNMYTRKSHRGIGIGEQLFTGVLNSLQRRGDISIVDLEVEDTQLPAIALYKSKGFEEIKRVPEGDGFMITMEKPLRPRIN